MRELRDTDPTKYHLVSCRTIGSELLFVPRPEMNEILGGVIAKYQAEQQIDIYALSFLTNHYHMLLRATESNLPLFFENVAREVAHRVNRHLDRTGPLWSRRYDDLITLEPEDVLEAFLYVTTNPVKHGLVQHPKQWPGLCSYWQSLGRKNKQYAFTHYTEYHQAKRKAAACGDIAWLSDYQSRHTLRISPLPENLRLDIPQIEQLLEKRTKALVVSRKAQGKGFLGRAKVLATPPRGAFPKEVSKSTRPPCYSKNAEAIREFRKERQTRRHWYAHASREFRLKNFSVEFPPHCLFPPLHHIPKEPTRHPT